MSSVVEKEEHLTGIIIIIKSLQRSPGFLSVDNTGVGSTWLWTPLGANGVVVFSHVHPGTRRPAPRCWGGCASHTLPCLSRSTLRSRYSPPGWHGFSSHPAGTHPVICQELPPNFNADEIHPDHV